MNNPNQDYITFFFAGHFAIDNTTRFKLSYKPSLGGSVAYCSLALSTYTQDVNIKIISHIGKLNFNNSLLDNIKNKKIDLKGIKYSQVKNTNFLLD